MTATEQAAKELMKATFWEAFWRGVLTGLLLSIIIIGTVYYFAEDIVREIN